MNRRMMAGVGAVGFGLATIATGLSGSGFAAAGAEPRLRSDAGDRAGGLYAVLVPRGQYQAIVISPEPDGAAPSRTIRFTLRAREKSGVVADFPVFVRAGALEALPFPNGLSLTGEAFLLAPASARFAAWGVAAATRPDGSAGPGPIVRFDPVQRDPRRDIEDREREREYEELIRAWERNR